MNVLQGYKLVDHHDRLQLCLFFGLMYRRFLLKKRGL